MKRVATPSTTNQLLVQGIDRIICLLLRYWLVLMLVPLILFVTGPFLAPVAMHLGWTGLGEAIYWLYTPFCHQLPQRSWFLFGEKLTYSFREITDVFPATDVWTLRRFYGTPEMGWKVAWSDRMISFYTLIPVFGLLSVLFRHAGWKVRPLPLQALLWTLGPLGIDGFTHLLNDIFVGDYASGFRDTNYWLVVLTGNAYPNFYAGDSLGTFNWWMRLLTGVVAAWGIAFTIFPFVGEFMRQEAHRYCTHQEIYSHTA
jgi:hypothetical protein